MVVVSIVIPTFNRGEYLPRAIDSALDQTFADIEILVVDDGSTDNTTEIVNNYDDDRVQYLRHETNMGANAARNTGIKTSNGQYVSLLDSDDELHPEYLEKSIPRLENCDSDVSVGVFTSFRILTDKGIENTVNARSGRITSLKMFKNGPVGTFSCVTFKSSIFDKIGLLDESLVSCQDLDFYIRVLRDYEMIGVDQVLVDYHSHSDNLSNDTERRLKGQKVVLEKHKNTLPDEFRAAYHYKIADRLTRLDRLPQAQSELRKAICLDKHNVSYPAHYAALKLGKKPYHVTCYIRNLVNQII